MLIVCSNRCTIIYCCSFPLSVKVWPAEKCLLFFQSSCFRNVQRLPAVSNFPAEGGEGMGGWRGALSDSVFNYGPACTGKKVLSDSWHSWQVQVQAGLKSSRNQSTVFTGFMFQPGVKNPQLLLTSTCLVLELFPFLPLQNNQKSLTSAFPRWVTNTRPLSHDSSLRFCLVTPGRFCLRSNLLTSEELLNKFLLLEWYHRWSVPVHCLAHSVPEIFTFLQNNMTPTNC